MRIRNLDIKELLQNVQKVERELSRKQAGKKLLEEAIADFPALETLYFWMCKIAASDKRHKRLVKNLLAKMERDFVVLLALWDMDRQHERQIPDRRASGDKGTLPARLN